MASAFKQKLIANFQPVVLGADLSTVVAKIPFDATITGVTVIPNAALAGANTNTRKHEVFNKAADGLGANSIAALQYNAGVSLVAFDEKPLTLSGTTANLDVSAGDVLALISTHVGTGIADAGGLIVIEITRRTS